MERTISITPWALKTIKAEKLKGYDAVYLGCEFCENKLPSPGDFALLRKIFPGPVTAVTSMLSETGLERAKTLAAFLARGGTFEIVVNDWGLLRFLKKKYPLKARPALLASRRMSSTEPEADQSRLLGQKGGARPILGRLLMWEIAGMDKRFLNDFCLKHSVKAVETDSPEILEKLKGFKGAVHFNYPLRFRSVTRFCPHTKKFNSEPCAQICEKRGPVRLKNAKVMPEPIYMHANAYFVRNKPLKHASIKRLVETLMEKKI